MFYGFTKNIGAKMKGIYQRRVSIIGELGNEIEVTMYVDHGIITLIDSGGQELVEDYNCSDVDFHNLLSLAYALHSERRVEEAMNRGGY